MASPHVRVSRQCLGYRGRRDNPAMTGRVFCVRRRSLVGRAGVAAAAAEPTAETAEAAQRTDRAKRADRSQVPQRAELAQRAEAPERAQMGDRSVSERGEIRDRSMAKRAQRGDAPDIGDGNATAAMIDAVRGAARLGGGGGETDEGGRNSGHGNRSRNALHALGSCLVGLPLELGVPGRGSGARAPRMHVRGGARRAHAYLTSTTPTWLARLLARIGLPSRLTSMLRTMSPPPGIGQLWNFSVLGSNRTMVFGFAPDSQYQMPPLVAAMP